MSLRRIFDQNGRVVGSSNQSSVASREKSRYSSIDECFLIISRSLE